MRWLGVLDWLGDQGNFVSSENKMPIIWLEIYWGWILFDDDAVENRTSEGCGPDASLLSGTEPQSVLVQKVIFMGCD